MRSLHLRLGRFGGTNSLGVLSLIAVIAVILGIGFLKPAAVTADREAQREVNKKIQVDNKTQSLEVISAETSEGWVHISLRNNSKKSVDGLQVRVGDVAVQTEFLGTDITFQAGSVFAERYPTQQDSNNRGVTILCVVFDDGSSEGQPKYIKQIDDTRLGARTQTRRALSLIDQALARSNVNTETLEKLKTDISSLPVRDNDDDNNDIVAGLQNRRAQLISQIEGVRSAQAMVGTNGPQELIALKQHLNRSIKQ
jgi:hypothetical protein